MAHGIYNTKAQAQKVMRELEKKHSYRKGRLKVITRYIIADK